MAKSDKNQTRGTKRRRDQLLGGEKTDEQKLDSILGEGTTANIRARMADKEKSGLLGDQMTDKQRLRKALGKEPSGYKKGGKTKAKKYNKGGKVRGCGVARQGVRKAKMVVMKGS